MITRASRHIKSEASDTPVIVSFEATATAAERASAMRSGQAITVGHDTLVAFARHAWWIRRFLDTATAMHARMRRKAPGVSFAAAAARLLDAAEEHARTQEGTHE